MNNEHVARELVKLAKALVGSGMTENAVKKYIDNVNKYIAKARKDDIPAVEPDSTWETAYEFEPVTISRKSVVFKWSEVYGGKKDKEIINYTDEMKTDDLKWQFHWVIRSIKKGYKEEGKTPPRF